MQVVIGSTASERDINIDLRKNKEHSRIEAMRLFKNRLSKGAASNGINKWSCPLITIEGHRRRGTSSLESAFIASGITILVASPESKSL
jgi:fructose-1,6-bisphosphatase/inositol monophosphatase family enzyme